MLFVFAICIGEPFDEVIPSLNILFELTESEETTVDHPGRTPLRVSFDTVLRSWRF